MTLNDLVPVIRRASKSVAYQWPGVVDQDDIEQAIYLRLFESDGSVEKILAMEDRARYRAVVGMGHQLASAERSDYDHFKGSYTYSVYEIKDLLKMGILTDEPPSQFRAELVDMHAAIDAMHDKTPQYVDAICDRYIGMQVPGQGAPARRLSTALTTLADSMNKVARNRHSERDDGPGTRQSLTNAQAMDLSGSDWDGEDEEP